MSNACMPCTNTLRRIITRHFCILLFIDTSGAHKESVKCSKTELMMPGLLRRMPTLSYASSIILSQLFLEHLDLASPHATTMKIRQQ